VWWGLPIAPCEITLFNWAFFWEKFMSVKKRKPKKGYVYFLRSKNEEFGKTLFKYGCSSISVESRVSKINSNLRGKHDFSIVCSFKSDDIYSDENKVKWGILDFGFGAMSEFITRFDDMTDEQLVYRFKEILSHLVEVEYEMV